MGGLCESTTVPTASATKTVSGTSIPEWVSQGGQELWESAKGIAGQEYPTYGGPRVAGPTADETSAYGLTRGALGAYQPYMAQAGTQMDKAGEGWSSDVADRYINPYQEGVLDIAAGKMREQGDIDEMSRNARAVQMGAFGGAKQGVIESRADDVMQENVGELYARGMGDAYDKAGGMFQADRGAALGAASGYGALGQMESNLGFTDADILMRSGQTQRASDQASLDTAYGDFLEQREWPYRQTNFAMGALQGVPYETKTSTTGTGTGTAVGASPMGQVGGLALAGLGAYNMWQ